MATGTLEKNVRITDQSSISQNPETSKEVGKIFQSISDVIDDWEKAVKVFETPRRVRNGFEIRDND